MNNLKLIKRYRASDISIPKKMIGWMRSNHAGETGAVWIYLGAKCIFWNKQIQNMSKEHYQTEKNHLKQPLPKHIKQTQQHTNQLSQTQYHVPG